MKTHRKADDWLWGLRREGTVADRPDRSCGHRRREDRPGGRNDYKRPLCLFKRRQDAGVTNTQINRKPSDSWRWLAVVRHRRSGGERAGGPAVG